MRKALHAVNGLILVACFAAGGLAALFYILPMPAALSRLNFQEVSFFGVRLAVALLYLMLTAYLWRRNEEFGRGVLGVKTVAAGVPVLGVMAAIAVRSFFSQLSAISRPSYDKSTVSNLGAIRSALSLYYGDMGGDYPLDLSSLKVNSKYISEFPSARTAHHRESREVFQYGSAKGKDTGAWGYVNNPRDNRFGEVFVDCTHTDYRGSVWNGY